MIVFVNVRILKKRLLQLRGVSSLAHYGTSVDSAAFMERALKIAMQKEDLTEITKTIEQFYEEHGCYRISKAETAYD